MKARMDFSLAWIAGKGAEGESKDKDEIVYDLQRPDKATLAIMAGILIGLGLIVVWRKVLDVGSGLVGE